MAPSQLCLPHQLHAKSAAVAANAAIAHNPAAPVAELVGAGVRGAVTPGASDAPGAAVRVLSDRIVTESVPTWEYTVETLLSQVVELAALLAAAASVAAVTPLPEATAASTTSEPIVSPVIEMYPAGTPSSVARLEMSAAVKFALSVGELSTKVQFWPPRRSVSAISTPPVVVGAAVVSTVWPLQIELMPPLRHDVLVMFTSSHTR